MKNNPQQSKQEEITNTVLHGVGLVLAIAAFIVLVFSALKHQNTMYSIGISIFGITLITLYFASTMYHGLPQGKWKNIFHKIDHISIYLLIAGTYAPVTLVSLPEPWKWTIFSIIWGIALLGIFLKLFWFQRFKYFSLFLYAVMGWMIVVAIKPLMDNLNATSITFLAAGGFFYTVGIGFYVWRNLRFSHSIWHLFVLGGSICHFFMVYRIFDLD